MWCVYVFSVCACMSMWHCSVLDVWVSWLPIPSPFTDLVSRAALGSYFWVTDPESYWPLNGCLPHSISLNVMQSPHFSSSHACAWRQSQNSVLLTNSSIIYTCSCSVWQALGSRWKLDLTFALRGSPHGSRLSRQEGSPRRWYSFHWPSFPSPQLSEGEAWGQQWKGVPVPSLPFHSWLLCRVQFKTQLWSREYNTPRHCSPTPHFYSAIDSERFTFKSYPTIRKTMHDKVCLS